MREIDIEEAAGYLPQLVSELAAGEEMLLTRDGSGVAKLTQVPPRGKIRLGVLEGRFQVPDDFDAPLPDVVLALFYDGPIFPDRPPRKDGGDP